MVIIERRQTDCRLPSDALRGAVRVGRALRLRVGEKGDWYSWKIAFGADNET